MNKLFIHAGFPKTGTTTLQKCLFPLLELDYWGKIGSTYPHQEMKEVFLNGQPIALNLKKTTLVSEEGIAFFGNNHNEKAKHLKEITKGLNAELIFTIRKQGDLIPSFYAQTYRGKNFDEFVSENCFDYEKLIHPYEELFKVHIFPIEGLFDDNRLANLLGVSRLPIISSRLNVRKETNGNADYYQLNPRKLKHHPFWRHFSGTPLEPCIKRYRNWRIGKFRISHECKENLNFLYRSSNFRLSEKYGLSLEKYGYF